jgi:DNA-binding FadR family transcriptional regulator
MDGEGAYQLNKQLENNSFRIKPEANLPEVVTEKLVDMVKEGKFSIGDKLPTERELASFFGVGRTTIREAMRILEHEGIVQVRQGVGAFLVSVPQNNLYK